MPPRLPESKNLPNENRQYLDEVGRYDLLSAEEEVSLAKYMRAGQEANQRLAELTELNGHADKTEVLALERMVRAGLEARELFINSNLRLVVSMAQRYVGRGMDMPDLIQEGNTGLIRAVDGFDPDKGFRFTTYATWWVRQSLLRAVAEQSRNIKLTVPSHDLVVLVNAIEASLNNRSDTKPTTEEIAEAAGLTVEKVKQAKSIISDTVSLQTPVGEESDAVLGDFVPSDVDVETEVIRNVDIQAGLERLSERERAIIVMRFGLYGNDRATLDEVGQTFNVTRERIRQIEQRALSKMRHPSQRLRNTA